MSRVRRESAVGPASPIDGKRARTHNSLIGRKFPIDRRPPQGVHWSRDQGLASPPGPRSRRFAQPCTVL